MLTGSAALVVTAGALIGGFVSGLAGFGTGLAALGIWLGGWLSGHSPSNHEAKSVPQTN